jgi:hypothetical protein
MSSMVKLGLTAGLLAAMSACSPMFYVPNAHNVPMLMGRGDGSVSGQVNGFGVEVQGAYAIRDHLGIVINASGGRDKNETRDTIEARDELSGDGTLIEAGVGYFRRFADNRFVWENYALLGIGNIENVLTPTGTTPPPPQSSMAATYMRFAIQPSLAFHSKHFDVAASVRVGGLRYSAASGRLVFEEVEQVAYLNGLDTQFLVEPAVTVRAGWHPVKVLAQMGSSRNLTTPEFRQVENYVALGLVYTFKNRR